jgi:ABC-type enterobactin transport system permease subunit
MSKFTWLRPSYFAALIAMYALFAMVAGVFTAFAFLAAKSSPHGLELFLAGVVIGALSSAFAKFASKRRLLKRAFNALPHPI